MDFQTLGVAAKIGILFKPFKRFERFKPLARS
jgi:hypothetical protein